MNKTAFFENSNLISGNLRRLRKERRLSQEELAARLQLLGVDIDQVLVSRIERNCRFVKDYELLCICRVLDVEVRDLLDNPDLLK